MIYGRVADWERRKGCFPAVFDTAFSFLARRGDSLPDGRHVIDGERLFASVEGLHTQEESRLRFEIHARYLDIQILLSGVELQGYAPDLSDMVLLEDALHDKDIAFYSPPLLHSSLLLEPGHFVVYFPGEPHRPCCAAAPGGHDIRKVVFKVLWQG